MIITLKSNARDDTARFSNFYPEGLTIPPNAELGLVNISFTIEKDIAIGATNKSFQIRVGNQTTFSTIEIAEGIYPNAASLFIGIQTALQAWFTTQSAHIRSLFPPAQQTVTGNGRQHIIMNIVYDQESINLIQWNTTAIGPGGSARFVNATLVGNVIGDGGSYLKTDPAALPLSLVKASDNGQDYVLAATHQIGKDFFAVWEFDLPQAEQNWTGAISSVYLGSTADQLILGAPITVNIDLEAGNLGVQELIGNTPTNVLATPLYTYTAGDKFSIRIPLFSDPTIKQTASYFAGGNEIPSVASAGGTARYDISFDDKFFPVLFPYQTPRMGLLSVNAATQGNKDVPLTWAITGAGLGYNAGFIAKQANTSGTGINAKVMITSTNDASAGEVFTFTWIDLGDGHQAGDFITFDKPNGGGTNQFGLTINTVGGSFAVTVSGATYAAGNYPLALVGGGLWPSGTPPIVSLTENAGVINVVTLNTAGSGLVSGTTYQITGGNGAGRLLVRTVENEPVSIQNFKGSLSTEVDEEDPLESQDVETVLFNNELLRNILDVKPRYTAQYKGGLEIDGLGQVVNNDTSSHICHVQVDEFELESREAPNDPAGGANGKTVGVVCAGAEDPDGKNEGFFYKEQFNIIYNRCKNKETVNHNELNIRLTDESNNPFKGAIHPVTITLDLKPDMK